MVRKTSRMATRKNTIIERLTAGEAVAQAARAAGISRAVAYTWKIEDSKFSAAWDDAVDEGIDMLETIAYRRAVDGNDGLLTMYLKCRRPEKWNPQAVAHHIIDERNANVPTPPNQMVQANHTSMQKNSLSRQSPYLVRIDPIHAVMEPV
jgi:hypothetical protein